MLQECWKMVVSGRIFTLFVGKKKSTVSRLDAYAMLYRVSKSTRVLISDTFYVLVKYCI